MAEAGRLDEQPGKAKDVAAIVWKTSGVWPPRDWATVEFSVSFRNSASAEEFARMVHALLPTPKQTITL